MSEFDETQQHEDPLAVEEDAGAAPDPFAGVAPDLPPGVEPGSLGGVNPSEEAAALEEPQPEEVGPGPGDEVPGEDEVEEPLTALDEEPLSLGEEEPLPPEDAGLGDEVEAPAAVEEEVEGDAPEGETDQGDLTAPIEGGQDSTTEVKGSQTRSQSRKKKAKKGEVELQPGQRQYTILRFYGDADGKANQGRLWEEAMPEPLVARSGDLALRKAYRILTGNSVGSMLLVPVPTKYWNPEEVAGEVPETSLTIKVGNQK